MLKEYKVKYLITDRGVAKVHEIYNFNQISHYEINGKKTPLTQEQAESLLTEYSAAVSQFIEQNKIRPNSRGLNKKPPPRVRTKTFTRPMPPSIFESDGESLTFANNMSDIKDSIKELDQKEKVKIEYEEK